MDNLITKIFELMASDDGCSDKWSKKLIEIYKKATPDQREVVNESFAALCGNRLDTILEDLKDEEEANEEEKDDSKSLEVL